MDSATIRLDNNLILRITKMQKEHNMESIIYVGMDVHKDSHSVCCYKAKEDKFYYEKKILSESKRVIRYLESVKKRIRGRDFICLRLRGRTDRLRSLQGSGESRVFVRRDGTDIAQAPHQPQGQE